jgi:hypothetical protein
MPETTESTDLETRTATFARLCRVLVAERPVSAGQSEDAKKLIDSSSKLASSYVEFEEAEGREASIVCLKQCHHAAMECHMWLQMIGAPPALVAEAATLAEYYQIIVSRV